MAVSAVPDLGARATGCLAIAHALRRRAHGESDHSDVRFGSGVSERGSERHRGGEQGVFFVHVKGSSESSGVAENVTSSCL